MVIKGERDGGGINQEFGINRYTSLYIYIYIYIYIQQVNNKDIFIAQGNYIQYLIITYTGKESEKVYII